jgi:hypothetical protein
MTTDTYLAIREWAISTSTRALELAALVEQEDGITAHNLRLMALYGGKVAKPTRLRMTERAASGGEEKR